MIPDLDLLCLVTENCPYTMTSGLRCLLLVVPELTLTPVFHLLRCFLHHKVQKFCFGYLSVFTLVHFITVKQRHRNYSDLPVS